MSREPRPPSAPGRRPPRRSAPTRPARRARRAARTRDRAQRRMSRSSAPSTLSRLISQRRARAASRASAVTSSQPTASESPADPASAHWSWSIRPSIRCTARVTSMLDTFGKATWSDAWSASRCSSGSWGTEARYTAGASSSTPGWNTTKKFGWKLFHRTSRRLTTSPSTATPCTSKRERVAEADAEVLGEVDLERHLGGPRGARIPRPGERAPGAQQLGVGQVPAVGEVVAARSDAARLFVAVPRQARLAGRRLAVASGRNRLAVHAIESRVHERRESLEPAATRLHVRGQRLALLRLDVEQEQTRQRGALRCLEIAIEHRAQLRHQAHQQRTQTERDEARQRPHPAAGELAQRESRGQRAGRGTAPSAASRASPIAASSTAATAKTPVKALPVAMLSARQQAIAQKPAAAGSHHAASRALVRAARAAPVRRTAAQGAAGADGRSAADTPRCFPASRAPRPSPRCAVRRAARSRAASHRPRSRRAAAAAARRSRPRRPPPPAPTARAAPGRSPERASASRPGSRESPDPTRGERDARGTDAPRRAPPGTPPPARRARGSA